MWPVDRRSSRSWIGVLTLRVASHSLAPVTAQSIRTRGACTCRLDGRLLEGDKRPGTTSVRERRPTGCPCQDGGGPVDRPTRRKHPKWESLNGQLANHGARLWIAPPLIMRNGRISPCMPLRGHPAVRHHLYLPRSPFSARKSVKAIYNSSPIIFYITSFYFKLYSINNSIYLQRKTILCT